MDACTYPHEEQVAVYVNEWRRWQRGEGVTVRSSSMELDDGKAIEREARKDQLRPPPTITASAERTDKALKQLSEQSEQQQRCLVIYHLSTTCNVAISRRVGCKRQRVPELLRWAHDNFIAIRGAL